MKKRFIAYILISAGAVFSTAAQTLSEEVTIDREITPVVRPSVRPGTLSPHVISPQFAATRLSFSEYTEPAEITRSFSPLSPVAWADSVMRTPYRGYASIGYFPTYNLGAAAGYRFVHNSRTDVGAKLAFDGNSWSGGDGAESKFRRNELKAGIDGSHHFKGGTLSAALGYKYSSTTAARFPAMYERGTQAANFVDFNLGWQSVKTHRFDWDLSLRIGYGAFTKNKTENLSVFRNLISGSFDFVPIKDATIGFDADLGYKVKGNNAFVLGIGLDFRHLNTYNYLTPMTYFNEATDSPEAFVMAESAGAQTQGIVTIRPGYTFDGKVWTGRLGIRADFNTGGLRGGARVAPEIKLCWHPSSRIAVEADATGGEIMNTNESLWLRNPWMTGVLATERSHVNADIQLSATYGSYKGFWAKLSGGWSSVSNWLVPVTIDGVNTWHADKSFNGFNVGLELGYAWRDVVRVVGHARAATHARYYLWQDNAKYTVDIAAKVCPIKKLQIELGFDLRAQRRGTELTAVPALGNNAEYKASKVNLGNASNLFAGVEYKIFNPLTIFLKAENLLNRHWDITNNVRSAGIHGLLGLQLTL